MITGTLQGWSFLTVRPNTYKLVGYIYNDTKGRFRDGDMVTTSRLKSIDFDKMEAKTVHSLYKLEPEVTNA